MLSLPCYNNILILVTPLLNERMKITHLELILNHYPRKYMPSHVDFTELNDLT